MSDACGFTAGSRKAAIAVLSPWVDLTLAGGSVRSKESADPSFTAADMHAYADLYVGSGDSAHPLASPVFADLTGLPPLLVQVGANEVLLDDAVRLAGRTGADGVEVTLEVGPGLPHVFQHHYGRLDEADAALDRAARFLTAHLSAGRPTPAVSKRSTDTAPDGLPVMSATAAGAPSPTSQGSGSEAAISPPVRRRWPRAGRECSAGSR
ncbi:alpha/beta hydrolase fold domain-containing protein [Kitasatospora sp. NPDC090091]|uniref:alpha/beta hydrolase fold domain-containing protein n=1 Tax=Kitasatospora sp. NPDC090091 TaxID=3364081 RepID=UPI00380C44EB